MATPTDVQTIDTTAVVLLFTPTQATFLATVAETGVDREAIAAVGIDRRTLKAWREDRAFAEALADAHKDFTERMVSRLHTAVMGASGEELLNHPNASFFVIKQRDNSFRDGVTVSIDNRQQTINVLSPEQSAAVARALAGVADDEPLA